MAANSSPMSTTNGKTALVERTELDELKARVDLVAFVQESGVALKKNGKSWLGQCPFHEDQTASLSVNPEANLWNCFGCQTGGDIFRFLQLKEELSFPKAVERVRGLVVGAEPLPSPEPVPVHTDRFAGGYTRAQLLERVANHYHQELRQHTQAQQYLSGRGLDPKKLVEPFSLGFCNGTLHTLIPDEGPLRRAMTELGVLTAAGKELFRGCLVVPLTHPDHGVVGLYGRRIRSGAKVEHLYLPGPHRGVFHWQALKLSSRIYLTESVLDALSLWQAGVREVSCLYGTSGFSDDLVESLRRFGTREVVLCFDGDPAGRQAVSRITGRLSELGIRSFQVTLPEGQDPNRLLMDRGLEALRQLVQSPTPVAEHGPEEDSKHRVEHTAQGLRVELGDVVYQVIPRGPFTGRLRVTLRAGREQRKFAPETVDLYSRRGRAQAAVQLAQKLELSRLVTERHLLVLLEACETWVEAQGQVDSSLAESQDSKEPMTDNDREEALDFLRDPRLVERTLADMVELGYVGEENPKLLVYLVGLSRRLERPLSAIIKSQSGAGKSSLADVVEVLTPPEDVMVFTRMSAQALNYTGRFSLRGKLLKVEERVGAEAADYALRVLQSKKSLTQAVVVKDPTTGKMNTQINTVEGPVAYLETTTNLKLNHENATRCFEIVLDESREQTRRIHLAQRAHRLPSGRNRNLCGEAICRRHHNAQRLLEPVLVFIPYVEHITFPDRWLRTRRDHERFLCLIEVAAFWHQHQRERGQTEDGSTYVLADLEDYRLAYRLAQDVLATTLHELSRDAQDLWQSVLEWVQVHEPIFTRRDLRQFTGLEDHRLRQALGELEEMEYVGTVTGQKGKAYRYQLLIADDQQTPSPLRDILSPEELEKRWKGAQS